MKNNLARAFVEVSFIIFLFYSNLLMGEFNRNGAARGHTLAWALNDIFTPANFLIAVIASLIGYLLAELLRHRLQ
jgi:hypothetical protein